MPRFEMSDVIVVLPGILGSVLQKNGRDVWNLSGSAALPALLSLGRNLNDLILDPNAPDPDAVDDGVVATALLPDLHLVPGLWKIDGYGKIRDTIGERFDVTPGKNYFEFPYDWRRDNRVAAKQLATRARQWLADWRRTSGNRDARLVLIGHSMGGIVSRYFLEVLDGWRDTRALFTFGTPYRGSLNALDSLSNGIRKGPFGLVDLSALVRSLTSAHQLLPTYPCYDGGDGSLVRVDEAEIPNLDRARAHAALAFHKEIADAVTAHQRDGDYLEHGYKRYGVIGIGQPTLQSARRDGDGLAMLTQYGKDDLRGDGTVPRPSATPLEIDDGSWGMFASTAHASLQNADATLDQLTGVLTGIDLSLNRFRDFDVRRQAPVTFAIDVDDLYWIDEPVTAGLEASTAVAASLIVSAVDDGHVVQQRSVQLAPGARTTLELPPLPQGAYRATVVAASPFEPATDVFAVMRRG